MRPVLQIRRSRLEIAVRKTSRQQVESQLAMQIEPLRLPVEFVPGQAQPVQTFINGIQRRFGVPVGVGVVDAQHQCAMMLPHV